MPFTETETDEQVLARLGTDPMKWAEAYILLPHDPGQYGRTRKQLHAWFHHALEAGRKAERFAIGCTLDGVEIPASRFGRALLGGEEMLGQLLAKSENGDDPEPLPRDDRWFLAYDPTLRQGAWSSAPWVIATRCDNGFCDHEGYPVAPERWAPIPDPQPAGTGWKWPEGTVEICRARINETRWSGWMAHLLKPNGDFDEREPYLTKDREEANTWAREFADRFGLSVVVNEDAFDNIVPIVAP